MRSHRAEGMVSGEVFRLSYSDLPSGFLCLLRNVLLWGPFRSVTSTDQVSPSASGRRLHKASPPQESSINGLQRQIHSYLRTMAIGPRTFPMQKSGSNISS